MSLIFNYHQKLPEIIDDRKEFLIRRYATGKILNAGCGNLKIPKAVNLDINKNVKPDIVADFHQMPFKDNTFDTIFTFDTIEHTDKPKDFVQEMLRIAKPNGTILIVCDDFDIQSQNWDADPTHITYINQKILKKMLEPMGFCVFSLYRGYLAAINNPKKNGQNPKHILRAL